MNKNAQYSIIFLGLFTILTSLFAQSNKQQRALSNMPKSALLVIDIQNAYLPYMSKQDVQTGMGTINKSVELFRKANCPIIAVYHTDPQSGPAPGTEQFNFPSTVLIGDSDLKVIKNYPSAFTRTDLDSLLKKQGCDTIYLCGLSAVGCVLATYFGAMDRGYDVTMISEGLISHNAEYTDVIRKICKTMSFEKIRFMFENKE